jgi:hypothetical protein
MESVYHRRHPTILEGLAQGRAAGGMSALKLPTHEQRLGLFQIERVEAFGEPAVDRSEKLAGLIRLA